MKLLCLLILSLSCIYMVSTYGWYGYKPEPANMQAVYPIYKRGMRTFKLLKSEAEFNELLATGNYFSLIDKIMIAKEPDDRSCRHLKPIYELYYEKFNKYIYMLQDIDVQSYIAIGWKDNGIVGYGVATKEYCEADLDAKHYYHEERFNDSSFFVIHDYFVRFQNYYDLGVLFSCWQ
ncbi:hypothetical protein T4B_15037 [Trichinella pseudospiralis]|uniref:DUF5648 domain-containing protein n=2 Tax=Trichinella pseudospiralis TaxID=6337 RepID=A0A0V1IAS0_TRIPS|nr:hypothetical protein T4B_15037 [Trichinella pseudospiralis]